MTTFIRLECEISVAVNEFSTSWIQMKKKKRLSCLRTLLCTVPHDLNFFILISITPLRSFETHPFFWIQKWQVGFGNRRCTRARIPFTAFQQTDLICAVEWPVPGANVGVLTIRERHGINHQIFGMTILTIFFFLLPWTLSLWPRYCKV